MNECIPVVNTVFGSMIPVCADAMTYRHFCYAKALVPSTCLAEYNSSSEYGIAPQENAMGPVAQELPSWT
eukprot:3961139-Alexandrium_andersonii.AAC.1